MNFVISFVVTIFISLFIVQPMIEDAKQPFDEPWGNYLLKKLVETQAPEPVSWLPQTIAWQFIYLLIMLWLIKKLWQQIIRYRKNAYRREALAWLAQLPTFNSEDPAPQYSQLPALIKKTALHHFSRAQVNQVPFKEWDFWLDSQCTKSNFSGECPMLLMQISYHKTWKANPRQMQQLLAQMRLWVKYHGA